MSGSAGIAADPPPCMKNAGVLRLEGGAARCATTGIDRVDKNPRTFPVMGSILRRKRLSDISNLASDGKAPRSYDVGCKENAAAAAIGHNKDAAYLAKLLMENTALMRAVAERNKILEMRDTEKQNLQLALQKLSQQNHQLAQANNHMLAERSTDKDRLKAFKHELGCCQAVLKVKTLQLEEKKKVIKELKRLLGTEQIRGIEMQINQCGREVPLPVSHSKACNTNRKRTYMSQSLGPATVNHQVPSKEKDESRRTSLRRRSIGVKHELFQPTEYLFEIEDVNYPFILLGSDPMSDSSGQDNSVTLVSSTMHTQ